MLVVCAPAKINLSLEVLGRRGDGYHELSSLMQSLTLHDHVLLRPWPRLRVTCSDPGLQGSENLVWKALELARLRCGIDIGCWAHVEKRIPVSAGLGGGSSDAAAALVGVARLWSHSFSCADLFDMASTLGSDVPYFLYGGACRVGGRGEQVVPEQSKPGIWYLLANPGVSVSTTRVFASLQAMDWSDGSATTRMIAQRRNGLLTPGPNSLRNTCFRLCPEAEACFNVLQAIAPNRTFLSGSGPTSAAMFASRAEAENAQFRVAGSVAWTCVAASNDYRAWRNPCANVYLAQRLSRSWVPCS